MTQIANRRGSTPLSLLAATAAAGLLIALGCAACGSGGSAGALGGRMLSTSDLPAGWKSAPVTAPGSTSAGSCLAGVPTRA
ncbi:MAG: hypothetical protein ACRDL5_03965, partial [Solirubrobacteraceae bacterium]